LKAGASIPELAARRLTRNRHGDLESRAAPVRRALLDALVRLDSREARRQADLLCAMDAGARRPLTKVEQDALFAKLTRLIAEANARSPQPEASP
jgi:hypothetical protein